MSLGVNLQKIKSPVQGRDSSPKLVPGFAII